MTLREEILAQIQTLPEPVLLEIQNIIKKNEEKPGLLRRLSKIKIKDAPPDFSRNIDLYLNGEKEIGQNPD